MADYGFGLAPKALQLRDLVIDALALPELQPSEHYLIDWAAGEECNTCGPGWPCPVTIWRAKAIEAVS